MIALDTNILVYAHQQDSPFHDRAAASLKNLVLGRARWAIPWPCVHEFIAVVTHARIYKKPTPISKALAAMQSLADCPNVMLLAEDEGYLQTLAALAAPSKLQGGAIHDARIAALCLHHGVRELWSADRDFSRFPALKTVNPLLEPA